MIIRILSIAAILALPLALSADQPTGKPSSEERRVASKERAKQRQAAKDAQHLASKEHRDHVAALEKEAADQAQQVAKRKNKKD